MCLMLAAILSPALLLAEEAVSPAPAATAAAPATPAPAPKIDTGDTAWMIVATALVMLMSIPGLALFYGGLSKTKDTLNTMAMTFVTFCIVSVLWVLYGYTFAFGEDVRGIIGSASKLFLEGRRAEQHFRPGQDDPRVYLHRVPAHLCRDHGSSGERRLHRAHEVLRLDHLLRALGDHRVSSGRALGLGRRSFLAKARRRWISPAGQLCTSMRVSRRSWAPWSSVSGSVKAIIPGNLTLVVIGAGLLWFGWFGFNAGSALAANGLAGAAFINTNTAAAVAALAWMFVEWMHSGKPTVLGLASGAVGGLVAITPAAGFVNIGGAIVIGIAAGVIPFYAVAKLKPMFGYDDTLDAFGIHGIGGTIGAILTGVFADPAINEAGKGLLYGNPGQLLTQLIAVAVTLVYSGVMTFIIFMIIKATVGLRVGAEEETIGLDESEHGERAYNS